MTDNPRPPVAVRIVRPFATEDELLDNELETIGKTSIILIGAHARPTGVILRFELCLASGLAALRGEGRVLGHKEAAFRGQPGLALRFTRLDLKSKALVDRATAMREAKAQQSALSQFPPSTPSSGQLPSDQEPAVDPPAPSMPPPTAHASGHPKAAHTSRPPPAARTSRPPAASRPPPASRPPAAARTSRSASSRVPARPSTSPDPALARALTEDTPAPARARASARPSAPPPSAFAGPPPPPVPDLELAPRASRPPPPAEPAPTPAPQPSAPEPEPSALEPLLAPAVDSGEPSRVLSPPAGRDDLLARLRERARALPAERVRDILASRRGPG